LATIGSSATAVAHPRSATSQAENRSAQRVWPQEALVGHASAAKVGMWAFLASDVFSFAALLIAYGVLRVGAQVWQGPNDPDLQVGIASGLSTLLILSSLTMALAVVANREAALAKAGTPLETRGTTLWLLLTFALGVSFLMLQGCEYLALWRANQSGAALRPSQSLRMACFYLITGLHALHVVAGLCALGWRLLTSAPRRRVHARQTMADSRNASESLEALALYWHFVDLVWMTIFTFVYLMPALGPS